MLITNDIKYIGVDDHKIDLFEGQYKVLNGMSYNSYVILDEKVAIMDTVDQFFTHEWLDNLAKALDGRIPDYLVVSHMEPDHSANIKTLTDTYPTITVVGNAKTFKMIDQFFVNNSIKNRLVVNEFDTLVLGKHELKFIFAPMVHWPEVMMSYDTYDKVLFSADAFGKFGALDVDDNWIDEARRYYIGIVGKYGAQVQSLLKKVSTLDIQIICALHGPVLKENLGYYINLYDTWSKYESEIDGVLIAYTSIYGNTKKSVTLLKDKLIKSGCKNIELFDLARSDIYEVVSKAFAYDKIVLSTTTYNGSIFPFMNQFIDHLTERGFQNKKIGIIENGSWGIQAANVIKKKFSNSKNIEFTNTTVSISSALNDKNKEQIDKLVDELCIGYLKDESKDKHNLSALHNIGYGLYLVTSNDSKKDNGLIVNSVTQLTDSPVKIGVTINKNNYSHHIISQTRKMNVCCLTVDTPFTIIETFGFNSGRNTNKFENIAYEKSDNNLAYLPKYINSYMSLEVVEIIDLGSHSLFICQVTESRVLSNKESMTYAYYHAKVKPSVNVDGIKGYVCKICGFVYEGETLPDDYICPLCKHGAIDFEKI